MRIFKLEEDYNVGEVTVYDDRLYEALADITQVGKTPDISTDWKENFVSVSGVVVKPFIESISKNVFKSQSVGTFIVQGNNFDDGLEVHSDDINDNNFNILNVTPTEMTIEVTTTSELITTFNIYKSGVKNYGLTPTLTITDDVIGEGTGGVFLSEFSNNTNEALWVDWTLETSGAVNDTYFMSSNAGTPSSSTGPETALNGYYAFVETSNPNNGAGNYGLARTTNFRKITQIDFDYFMNGVDITGLLVEGYNGTNWDSLVTLSGQQQSQQNDAWLTSSTILDGGYEEIRFIFLAPTGYRADIALDNIKITSV